ncbi:ygfE [Wigglesworthia glossinidia endosymbiont of Glossina brevipalpis]|uniref:Cell division protein ZapA n=1 Tax=Wigglesworthia glossinidia brevipalpis TaxID=36870 RepID=Q8D2C1_WIGBR|nr:ygfE [Wigglesworthia glossinidia endosymbiont of Glossina brevipalpis]
MNEKPVDIQIFGRTLRINCPDEEKSYLKKASENLEKRLINLKEKSKISNTEQLLFIAALNMCYELDKEKNKFKKYSINIEKCIKLLKNTINQALIDSNIEILNKNSIKDDII